MPDFGTVQPLGHPGCSLFCRDLCFEIQDPKGVSVRLTHEVFLSKSEQHRLGVSPEGIAAVLTQPWQIHEDLEDPQAFMYYSEPSGPKGRLFFVTVKCIPRRFDGRRGQQVYRALGALRRRPAYGEAWVSSTYWIKDKKSKGVLIWP